MDKPWVKNLMLAAVALVVLLGVATFAYSLGARNTLAALDDGRERPMMQEGGGQFGPFMRGGGEGERHEVFGGFSIPRGRMMGGHGFGGHGVLMALRLLVPALLFGMLVLGVIAFFRTGGWRPAEAAAPAKRRKRS